jgi:RHH-type transcriptional regulator, proline utilization regulon repressor / proline dehydrogenase / delta 1-pyrroline-5-carboxylate dehydrogenase
MHAVYSGAMIYLSSDPLESTAVPAGDTLRNLYTAEETALTAALAAATNLTQEQRTRIGARAADWVEKVRAQTHRSGVIDAFLQEYGLSTNEGIILMRLSEALIRTPDFATAQELMRDKLVAGEWRLHAGSSPATLINAATSGLRFSAAWIEATGGSAAARLAAKLGDRVLHAAVVRGMGIMAGHFVLGSTIEDAVARAKKAAGKGTLYSFDMLGEAALTLDDAAHYYNSYAHAVRHLASTVAPYATAATANGLSVKLSALHPRYEFAKRASCVPDLIQNVRELALIAKAAGTGLTLDAEEADRLELSLQIFTALLADPLLADWDGLGIVIQAYQRRASATTRIVADAAKAANRVISVRLVKGAYWDAEIKRAQEMGLDSYPVFTRKEHTDISYLACAAQLLHAGPHIYSQFATHNAHTAAAIMEMAQSNTAFEFQRLHGMGEALHDEIRSQTGITSRVYAPVGNHKELLPYLVRRLLENGANSSFVNQLMNPEVDIDEIVRDPIATAQDHGFRAHAEIPAPREMFGGRRDAALGIDLTQSETARQVEAILPAAEMYRAASLVGGTEAGAKLHPVYNPANIAQIIGEAALADVTDVSRAADIASKSRWGAEFGPQMRADCLNRAADILERRMSDLMAYCVLEAGKTFPDAVAEIREAADFCRYYAAEAVSPHMASRMPLGVVACISPWNFPLAIFLGQVAAALAAGNSVLAKPAGQTPLIAHAATQILFEAGVPADALQLLIGGGDIGGALVSNRQIDAVCFTGSTATAKHIAASRADIGKADSVLIAETGGINAMIVDSTALLEQAVSDVVASAFQSAGQRCSACRLVCVQNDIAEDFDKMLAGAMALLAVGDPADLATDIGPIIDADARMKIEGYIAAARTKFRIIGEAPTRDVSNHGHFVGPVAFAVNSIADVTEEIFGPVLHVARFAAGEVNHVVDQVNALGFGLTLGVHSRIDARIAEIAAQAHVGNIYVNRNQIGAVVGVQPFGGEGLSGTGPKAGGPHYLLRLSRPGPAQNPSDDTGGQRANYAKRFDAMQRKHVLPGPTGEQNTLSLVPRGRLILAGDAQHLAAQIGACVASGNNGLIACELAAVARPVIGNLNAHERSAIAIADTGLATLLDGEYHGVVADGDNRAEIAMTLAKRAGAIIPLLSAYDDPERYFHERTLTIDTTAAGGNASLLAMQSSDDAAAKR